eukprot:gene16360-11694_t
MARIGGFNTSNNKVILNVYDLHDSNDIYYPWGLGLYHSGVQIGRDEYTFASSAGIFTHPPKGAGGAKFRESIELGEYKGTAKDLETVVNNLRSSFKGTDYHLLTNNCNHFANALVQRLLGREIPPFVNRMAYYGGFFACLLPDSSTGAAPVDQGNGGNASQGSDSSGSFSGGFVGRSSSRLGAPKTAQSTAVTTTSAFSGTGRKLGAASDGAASSLLQDRRRSDSSNRL